MTKTEMLFIRACKTNRPYIRLDSIYRRFYLRLPPQEVEVYIAHILINIVDKYFSYDLLTVVEALKDNHPIFGKYSYIRRVINAMINIIRFTEVNKLPTDFISPIALRR